MIARILIADDEELEHRALRLILSDLEGWEIELEEAANGRQAVEAALRGPIDLALLDVRMPGMDGLAAARELRSVQPGMRIVFVTAFDSFDYAREALRLGVDEYLVKPAEREAVRGTAKRALETLRAERDDEDRAKRAGADGARALALLEDELRSAISRDSVDGARLDSFLSLKGLGDGERLAVAVRPGAPRRGSAQGATARSAEARRLTDLAERLLRGEGWYVIGGYDEAEVRLAAAAPKGAPFARKERICASLDGIAAEAFSRLGVRIRLGASPSFPADGPALFAAAQDAASLARPDRPVAFLVPDLHEVEGGSECGERCGGPIVERAVGLLRARMGEDLSLADVASAVSCSPFHLSRLFRLHAGDTFVRVFTRLRVEAAKSLLRSGKYSVKEVGSMVGFNDQAYFARVFRRLEGLSPSEFRDDPEGGARSSAN